MYYWLRVSCGIVVVPTRLRDGAIRRRTERNRARERALPTKNLETEHFAMDFGNRQKP